MLIALIFLTTTTLARTYIQIKLDSGNSSYCLASNGIFSMVSASSTCGVFKLSAKNEMYTNGSFVGIPSNCLPNRRDHVHCLLSVGRKERMRLVKPCGKNNLCSFRQKCITAVNIAGSSMAFGRRNCLKFAFSTKSVIPQILAKSATLKNTKSFKTAVMDAHYQRVNISLKTAYGLISSWLHSNASRTCDNRYSIYVVGAALTSKNQTIIKGCLQMTRCILKVTYYNEALAGKQTFKGGNDGWSAWAFAAVYTRNQILFDSEPDIKIMFRRLFKYGSYKGIDSTSNHRVTNGVARFLVEYAMPGECLFYYGNNNGLGNYGELVVQSISNFIPVNGFGEFGSPNYGIYNYLPLLNVAGLDPNRVKALGGMPNKPHQWARLDNLVEIAGVAYRHAVLQVGVYWFQGNWAVSNGRGYPITGCWGPGTSQISNWFYFGGNFPHTTPLGGKPWLHTDNPYNIKSTGYNTAMELFYGFRMPVDVMMAGAVERARFVKSKFSGNFQSSYVTDTYAHYSEAGRLLQQASWRSRVAFLTNRPDILMNPVTFAVNPSHLMTGVVNPYTLQVSQLYGSQTYGTSEFENFLHSRDAVMQVTHGAIKSGAMGGIIIYVPTPYNRTVIQRPRKYPIYRYQVVPPSPAFDYIPPEISSDGHRLFYGFESVFVAVLSYSKITPGTILGGPNVTSGFGGPLDIQSNVNQAHDYAKVYNVYGALYGNASNNLPIKNWVDPIDVCIVMETASPKDFPGTSLTEKFKNFAKKFNQIKLPVLKTFYNLSKSPVPDSRPTCYYVNAANVAMELKWMLDKTGEAALSKPGNKTLERVNYDHTWPILYEDIGDNSGGDQVWVNITGSGFHFKAVDIQIPSNMNLV